MIERAIFDDLAEILSVQKSAFLQVGIHEQNAHLPPLVQTHREIADEFARRTFLKCTRNGKILGSVRAHLDDYGVCQIGRLVVLPEHQGMGIGTALMASIERTFEACAAYELFTGARQVHTVAFYYRLGYYTVSKRVECGVSMEFMRKDRVPPTGSAQS